MSVSTLIIDEETLRKVAEGVKGYNQAAENALEEALRGLQTAQANWSDADMERLQENLRCMYEHLEKLQEAGLVLAERCQKKLNSLAQVRSMTI